MKGGGRRLNGTRRRGRGRRTGNLMSFWTHHFHLCYNATTVHCLHALPPLRRLDQPWNILVTGIGGTGVVTIGALIGMAAHLDGKHVTVLDQTGLSQKAGGVMFQNFGERLTPSPLVAKLAADGRLGRKVGKGLYRYIDGKKTAPDPGAYAVAGITPLAQVDELAVEERLVYSMLNEAAMAMGEGVVRQPRDGDIGAIFGIGYPPFRGGPLRTIDTLGAAAVVDTLKRLAAQFGTRFLPAEALVEMAASGGRYYPAEV